MGRAPLPKTAQWEALAQHWHTTPAEARAQDENDTAVALCWLAAAAEAEREQRSAAQQGP